MKTTLVYTRKFAEKFGSRLVQAIREKPVWKVIFFQIAAKMAGETRAN